MMDKRVTELAEKVEAKLKEKFAKIDRTALTNTERLLEIYRENRVSANMFAGTSGYGYDDLGRDTFEKIFAEAMGAEKAIVRNNFVNGTHAIATAMFACLRPGDVLLAATGVPYDTLQSAIGLTGDYPGSMKYYGIGYDEVPLLENGKPDLDTIKVKASDKRVKCVEIQRSRGYANRPTLSVQEIGEICDIVHSVNPEAKVVVDNCYGEFVQEIEPPMVGADLVAGSLIKNPGGGLIATGGYVAGKAELVDAAAMRLSVPGIGGECGSYEGGYRLHFQGFMNAPHVVSQALKTVIFCAGMLEELGYRASPASSEERYDIIQSVELGKPELLEKFCRGIQFASPVDSYVTPIPWDMPGYEDQVIMAAGTFVQGASIELSCDGPMREPYTAFMQGGLNYELGKLGVMNAIGMLLK